MLNYVFLFPIHSVQEALSSEIEERKKKTTDIQSAVEKLVKEKVKIFITRLIEAVCKFLYFPNLVVMIILLRKTPLLLCREGNSSYFCFRHSVNRKMKR